MNKEPRKNDIWIHKEKGYLARIKIVFGDYVNFLDNQDGCENLEEMDNFCEINYFIENFVFIGKGKPLSVIFETKDKKDER